MDEAGQKMERLRAGKKAAVVFSSARCPGTVHCTVTVLYTVQVPRHPRPARLRRHLRRGGRGRARRPRPRGQAARAGEAAGVQPQDTAAETAVLQLQLEQGKSI